MKGPWLWIAGLLLFGVVGGCSSVARPNWLHPGTAQSQQSRAQRYDPYPETDAGPAMVGVRPRDYDKPAPETARARWFLGGWGQ